MCACALPFHWLRVGITSEPNTIEYSSSWLLLTWHPHAFLLAVLTDSSIEHDAGRFGEFLVACCHTLLKSWQTGANGSCNQAPKTLPPTRYVCHHLAG